VYLKGKPMLQRTILVAGLLLIGPAPAPAAPAATPAAPETFISSLGNQALEVVGSYAPLDQKLGYFRQMLHADFDLPSISRFVLGGYWRVASDAQREEFQQLFEDYLLRFYGVRLAQYGSGGLRVTGSRSDPAGVIVTSQIIRPRGRPVEVDWRLGISDGYYKIEDVAIERVSMALSYRTEFAAQIGRAGGQVEGLLTMLREESASSEYGSRAAPWGPVGSSAGGLPHRL
jgi:phospholipid transport system substrate-binding protein